MQMRRGPHEPFHYPVRQAAGPEGRKHREPPRSFARGFPPPLGEKGIQGRIGVITEQPTGECLGAANNLVDRPDTDLPTVEFHHNLAASLETDCLAKLCRNAEAARLRNPGKYA